jgi:NNP family nitrate/nitrite transporter-like MFS transporter
LSEAKSWNAPIQLSLGTFSFVICFAAWGLISSFAPRFRETLHLSATQTAFLVAVPVLLGALARIPMGMLTDLYGGRTVFTTLMLVAAIPPVWAASATTYGMLIAAAFCLGMAGSSFAVGVGFVSRWYPPKEQGTALGVYGLGEHWAIRSGVPRTSAGGNPRLANRLPGCFWTADCVGGRVRSIGAQLAQFT